MGRPLQCAMGNQCSADQDGADFPTNHTKREPGPTHAVKMGVSQPISTEKSLTISATGKSSLTLDCTDSEGTPLGHLTFPLVPPFKQGEIRQLVADKGIKIKVQFGDDDAPAPVTSHAGSNLSFWMGLLVMGAAWAWHMVCNMHQNVQWQLSGCCLFLTAMLMLILHAKPPNSNAAHSVDASLRMAVRLVESGQLQLEPVNIKSIPECSEGIWVVPEGKGGRYRDEIVSRIAQFKADLNAKDGEHGWQMTGTTNEVDFYSLTERPPGCVAFKGEGDIAVSVSTLLLYLLDPNQHKEFDADWDSPVFSVLRLEDDMTMLCKFGLVVPMHASRVMVTINYISLDPATGEAIYLFFSANDKESLAVAAPNPKSVVSEVEGAFLITPTGSSSCRVVMYSRATITGVWDKLLKTAVGGKPKQVARIRQLLTQDSGSAQRLKKAKAVFQDNWVV